MLLHGLLFSYFFYARVRAPDVNAAPLRKSAHVDISAAPDDAVSPELLSEPVSMKSDMFWVCAAPQAHETLFTVFC